MRFFLSVTHPVAVCLYVYKFIAECCLRRCKFVWALLRKLIFIGLFKKNLNASKPSEHPPQVEECLKVSVGTLAVETKPLHGIKRVPQCNYIGSTV